MFKSISIYKALECKFNLDNCPDKFKKKYLEFFLREKEEEYFRQHEDFFRASPVNTNF